MLEEAGFEIRTKNENISTGKTIRITDKDYIRPINLLLLLNHIDVIKQSIRVKENASD